MGAAVNVDLTNRLYALTQLNSSLFKSCSRKAKKDTMQCNGQTILKIQ